MDVDVAQRGLATPVDEFPRRLLDDLGVCLDKLDVVPGRDWRRLVDLLGLSQEDKGIVERSPKKTEVALRLWKYRVGVSESTAYALVEILKDMGRNDVVREVECFLGSHSSMSAMEREALQEFQQLDEAAKRGDNETLAKIIGDRSGQDLESKMFRSPLHSAVYYRHFDTVKFLIEKGFDFKKKDYKGVTPRDMADEEEIIKYLDKQVTKQDEVPFTAAQIGRTALDEAVFRGDTKRIRELLAANCDVDQAALPGLPNLWTPLHTAAATGNLIAAQLLVENGAKLDIQWDCAFIPEDMAMKYGHNAVADYLKMQRDQEEQCLQLPGQTITIFLEGDDTPTEYQIKSSSLSDILNGISEMMGVRVTNLRNRRNNVDIHQAKYLLFANDVIACTNESGNDVKESLDDNSVRPSANSRDEDEQFVVSVQCFSKYWFSPPEKLEFTKKDEYNNILDKASHQLGMQVDCLYTSEKLSKIRDTGVLSTKRRVIAATKSDTPKIKEEAGTLVFPKLVGDEQSKVFKSDGGVLFNFQHGVLIEVPPGAVKEGESVKMKVYIAVPDKRMDLCSEWGRLYPVSLPVVVVTDPPGHIFLKPIKLRIPHCGVYEPNWQPQNIAVLTSSFDLPLKSQLEFRRLPEDAIEVKDRHVVIRLFNFSWFWVFTEKAVFSRQCTVALYTPSDQYIRQTQDRFHAKIFVFPKLHFCSSIADKEIGCSAEGAGASIQYVLRARRTFVVTSEGNVNIDIENKGSDDWKIIPTNLSISFNQLWHLLYTSSLKRAVYDVDVSMTWIADSERKNDRPIQLQICLKGQHVSSQSCSLQLFIDLPRSNTPLRVLPPTVEDNLIKLFDVIAGDENERGWYALGAELGMTRDELEALKHERRPTKIILDNFVARYGEIQELIDAVEHLGYGSNLLT